MPRGGVPGQEGLVVVGQTNLTLLQNFLLFVVLLAAVNVHVVTKRFLWNFEQSVVMVTELFCLLFLLLVLGFLSIAWLVTIALEIGAM